MPECRFIFHFASVGLSRFAWMRERRTIFRGTLSRVRMLYQPFPTGCRTKHVLPEEWQQCPCRDLRIQSPAFPPVAGFAPLCPECPLRLGESELAFLSLGLESRP